jgi:uncharacterized membrane protein
LLRGRGGLLRVRLLRRIRAAIVAFAVVGAAVPGPSLAEEGAAPANASEPVRMQGVVAAVGDRLGFAPCDGAPTALVDASPAGDLAALVAAMEGHPRASAAVDADFRIRADAPWELVRLRRIHVGDRACDGDLADYVWRAHGDGDTWSLAISPRRLLLRHRDHAVPASFRYRPFELVEPGVRVFQASEGGDSIHLVLRSGRCGDAADDRRITDYSIEITWRGTRYEGCAWNGDPRR